MVMKPNRKTNRYMRKPKKSITKAPRVSKPMAVAIKKVVDRKINKRIETKSINVRDPNSLTPANTVSLAYNAGDGLKYLAVDVFTCSQGTSDSQALSSNNCRIGDKVNGVGFLMNYYFHTANTYYIGANAAYYYIPWVKIRVIVFRTAFGLSNPVLSTVYNNQFLNGLTTTLQPVDWNEGYVKEVLHDEVIIVHNTPVSTGSSLQPNSQLIHNNVYHFKKYIKFNRPIKYMDNNQTTPAGTDKPIYIAISAEVDESWTGGIPPSTNRLLTITGYTEAWFKDA